MKKRSGELQAFDRQKLQASVRKAGAKDEVAKAVAEKIEPSDGTPTEEIRNRVATELKGVDPAVAEAYARTLRLRAKSDPEVPAGTARIPRRIRRVPDVAQGTRARVQHGEKRAEVRVEPALDGREIRMRGDDLRDLGVSDGTRVAVRFFGQGTTGPSSEGPPIEPREPMAPRTKYPDVRPQ